MLSSETLSILKKATRMMYFSGAAPLVWKANKTGQSRLFLQDSKKYRFVTVLHCGVLILYNVFMWYRLGIALINHNHTSASPLSEILQIAWNLLSYSLPLVIMVNNFKFWNDVPNFINGFLECFNRLKDNYSNNLDPNWKNGCEKKLKFIAVMGTLILMMNTILILMKPEKAYFFTSLQENPKTAPILKKLPFILAQTWVWLSLWSHIYYYCFFLVPYAYAMVFVLGQLKNLHGIPTFNKFRQLRNFMRAYRELQTLHNISKSCFQSFFLPAQKYIVMNLAIIGSYGSIRIPGPRAITMTVGALMSLLYLSLTFRRFGKLYEKSLEVLHSWKRAKGRYIRKFVRSSQPIRVEIGFYYYVTKTTVIVIWATVFNFTANMLLSF